MQDLEDSLQTSTLRLNVQRYGAALVEKSRLLLVCCPSPALLEQQGNGLVSWLRRNHPELLLEAVPALEGELIIQRFNEILADVSIDAAVRPDAPTPPNRVWVLRDTGQLSEHDVRLLAKLQQQFPKARLSSIVITSQPDRFAALMAMEERGLLCWSQSASASTPQVQAPAPAPPAVPTPQVERPASPLPATKLPPVPRAKPDPMVPRTAAAPRSPQRMQKLMMGVVLGFATSTTLVVAGLLWLHSTGRLADLKTWMGKEAPASSAATYAPPPVATEATPQASPSASEPAAELGTSASSAVPSTAPSTPSPAPTPAATSSEGQPTLAAQPQAAGSSIAQANTSTSGGQPTPAVQARELDGRAPAQADPRVPAPVPPALRDGQNWASKLPAGNFLVVHGRFASVAQATQASKRQPYLQNARLLPAGPGATGQVMLVTGPFQSEPRARGYIARLELKEAAVLQVGDWLAR